MGREVEIKLVGAPADIAAFRLSPSIASLAKGVARTARLVSTYYDTDEGALAAAGLSLRLREEAGRRIQAIKRRRAGEGTLDRDEDERLLSPGDSFPFIPENPALTRLLAGGGALRPVARTVADRWTQTLEKGGARIEAAVDLGRLEAFDGDGVVHAAPLAEAELELVKGDCKALFKLARRCLKEGGGDLRLAAPSKEEQARALLAADDIGKQKTPPLSGDDTVGDVFAAALKSAAQRIIVLAPYITELRRPEGVHQMRVALRRFRAVERVFRPAVDDKKVRKLSKRAKKIAGALGAARDWDVFLMETLPPVRGAAGHEKGMRRLEAGADVRRAAGWERAVRKIAGVKFNLFALDLLEAAHRQTWRTGPALDEPIRRFAARALDARLHEARKVAAKADPSAPAARHPLRIALKKLRYGSQAFRSLYPKAERKAYMTALSRLQTGLGALNDAVVAETLANDAAIGQGKRAHRAAGFIVGYSAAHANAAAAKNDEAFAAFEAMAPFWRGED